MGGSGDFLVTEDLDCSCGWYDDTVRYISMLQGCFLPFVDEFNPEGLVLQKDNLHNLLTTLVTSLWTKKSSIKTDRQNFATLTVFRMLEGDLRRPLHEKTQLGIVEDLTEARIYELKNVPME